MGKEKEQDAYDMKTIEKTVKTAIKYIEFLKYSFEKYENINLNKLVKRKINVDTMLTGTTGTRIGIGVYDTRFIMNSAGIDVKNELKKGIKPINEEVFSEEEMEEIMKKIEEKDYQTQLMFKVMKYFGLRRGEVSNLMLDESKIPNDFYLWDEKKAKEFVEKEFDGDIKYEEKIKAWVCTVVTRKQKNFDY